MLCFLCYVFCFIDVVDCLIVLGTFARWVCGLVVYALLLFGCCALVWVLCAISFVAWCWCLFLGLL